MFADLVGSTALSARLDPEDLREVIATYHKCAGETVRRFDGFVSQYLGDGVGAVTILRTPQNATPYPFLQWVGADYATKACPTLPPTPTISAAGTHIIWADYCEDTHVQVASPAHIQIQNKTGGQHTVVLTFMY